MRSAVCTAEVMVVAAPAGDIDIRCGGSPMVPMGEEPPDGQSLDGAAANGTALGKRYVNESGDLEILCTKPGDGSLGLGETLLAIKEAKALPSSD